MNSKELAEIIKEHGIVGAGGAGFPTYMKIDDRAETIVLNCAECEPLLKLHRQLLEKYAKEIVRTFSLIAQILGAKNAVIGIKKEYKSTVLALEDCIHEYVGVSLHLLDSVYPMGDEVVLIYEATGKVVRPGGLPIEEGIAVFNVETMYNIYRALEEKAPVTDKLVTIVCEVKEPVTLRVPLGTTLEQCVAMAGGATVKDPVYLVGGPMMGNLRPGTDTVTKTTNAILVLSADHPLVLKKQTNPSIGLKRAASACCQCQVCTDLCPRHALGHPIQPHLFMRAVANRDFQDQNPFLDTYFCSACGLCELYSCPQGLAPRSLITEYKTGLRRAGVKPPAAASAAPVKESREYRKAPEKRLEARLGLSAYDREAPIDNEVRTVKYVKIPLSQHIGVPAECLVKPGDIVERGSVIAAPAKGLSVPIHASVSGRVVETGKGYVCIAAVSGS